MGWTNFPHGITSMGVPVLGNGFFSGGTHYFVDPANGSDSNDGLTWSTAKDTLTAAYNLCTTGKNDVVYLIGDGGTTGTARITESGGLTWSKNATHLIGITAPSKQFQRARISHSSTSGVGVTPLMTFSGTGCFISNVSFFQGYSTDEDQTAVLISGDRNCFNNVHFGGGGHLTPAARAATNSVTITAASENA